MTILRLGQDLELFGSREDAVGRDPIIGIDASGIHGWYSTPSIKTEAQARIGFDGDWARRKVNYNPRVITVKFNVFANGRAEHVKIWEQFRRLNRTRQRLRVEDHGTDRFVDAFIETEIEAGRSFKHSTGSFVATADDPLLYDSREQALFLTTADMPGGLDYPIEYPIDYQMVDVLNMNAGVLRNEGNADSGPVIRVTGDLPWGFTLIDNTGRTIEYGDYVSPSVPVVIDCERRVLTVNGVNRSWALRRREWFTVPAGGSLSLSFITPRVSEKIATAAVTYRSTYI